MKKLLYIASVSCALLFTGCEDFLTLESPDFAANKFWRDSVDVEMGLSATYGQLENRSGVYDLAEIKFPVEAFREDIMVTGADVANYPNWGELAKFSYNNGNSQLKLYWMNNYNGINYANNVIWGLNRLQSSNHPLTQETYDHLLGEASFLRGYYHMKLILNWERIVIRDNYMTTEYETHKALASREDAWDFIIEEFKTATKLPVSRPQEQAGRVTSGAAYAYMGWAYLTRAYETPEKRAEYLDKAIEAFNNVQGYSLEPDFLSMFNGTNKNCKESIFEIQFIESTENGTFHKHVLHKWISSGYRMGGWDEIRPSEMIINEFKKERRENPSEELGELDSRAYASAIFRDPYFETGKRIFDNNYDRLMHDKKTGEDYECFRKYLPTTMDQLKDNYCSTNIPVMRYANVMLMKAEALNELGRSSEAIGLIDQIREVHGNMPKMKGTTQEEVRNQIKHERLMEFSMENLRWYDLRRWGELDSAMKAAGKINFDAKKHSFYPVPLMEIQSNNEIN